MQCFLPALKGGQHNFHHTHSQPFHLLLSSLQSHVFQHLAAAPCPWLWLRLLSLQWTLWRTFQDAQSANSTCLPPNSVKAASTRSMSISGIVM